jgi:lysozyme family protein
MSYEQQPLSFDDVFARLIPLEGGYSNDPQDPGDETKFGISKRSYPNLDIANLTLDDAKSIYRRDFWGAISADRLPPSVVYQLFDFAVNSGPATAIRHLQRAVGVPDDGAWGPISQKAADRCREGTIIMRLTALRLEFLADRKNWEHAGKGWARRIATNLKFGADDYWF